MSPIDPSQSGNPFKIASAYGVKPIRVRPVPADPGTRGANAAGLNAAQQPAPGITRGADQLLAGSVNTQVDFMAGPPTGAKAKPAGSSLAFYRHPADTNAAATSIDLGRRLDVEG